MRARVAPLLALAILALGGCANPDAVSAPRAPPPSTSPQSPGEPPAPAPPSPSAQAPARVQPTPSSALAAFATLYVNWSYRTLAAKQRTLAAISVGAARASEREAAAASEADATLARARISNRGQLVSIARDLAEPERWVVVTREQTEGHGEYEGLRAAYHVTLARLALVPAGFVVCEWLPQS